LIRPNSRRTGRWIPPAIAGILLGLLLSVHPGHAMAPAQERDRDTRLKILADTEREFARTSVQRGVRDSFYEFFAEDGIAFQPHPVKLRDALRGQPAPEQKPPSTLDWEPVYGDIADSGDLGWLTGPYVLTDQSPQKQPPRWGFYSSVWRRLPNGSWRVALDLGITTPPREGPLPRNSFRPAPSTNSRKAALPAIDLKAAERTLAARAAQGLAAAYREILADAARLHREGRMPLTAADEIRKYLANQTSAGVMENLYAGTAASGELGYSYGRYELMDRMVSKEKGYYLRVWKLDPEGVWKVVLDVAKPLPPETKTP